MRIDPDTGMIDSYRLDEKDARSLTVTTPSHTYYYDRDADLVRSVGGTVAMTWVRWGRFFEDAVEWSQRLGGEIRTTQLRDPATGRDGRPAHTRSARRVPLSPAFSGPPTRVPPRLGPHPEGAEAGGNGRLGTRSHGPPVARR